MAYDEALAERVRGRLARKRGFSERRMFGGLCFLLNGNMCAGIVDSTLMLRVGPQRYAAALARPHAREMDFTGRPLKGMVYVDPRGVGTDAALERWLALALEFVRALPEKRPRAKRKRAARGR